MIQMRFKMDNIVHRLQEFMENEARSCSMDFGCVIALGAEVLQSRRLSVRWLK